MRYPFFVVGLVLSSSIAQASVVVGGTRLVFDGTKNNAVINVENKDPSSNIVQSWLSVADARSPAKDAFIITPPLFRL
ncbi:fimbrial assembly protein, partial [Klebsiella quasipneumoniae]